MSSRKKLIRILSRSSHIHNLSLQVFISTQADATHIQIKHPAGIFLDKPHTYENLSFLKVVHFNSECLGLDCDWHRYAIGNSLCCYVILLSSCIWKSCHRCHSE